jgi:hypothetical protein
MSVKSKLLNLYVRLNTLGGRKVVHFIHIGKTAGTAIKTVFEKEAWLSGNFLVSGNKLFVMHGHNFKLNEVKENESVIFVVRDPIQRFVSGFYSRKRMGRPLNYNPWNEGEKKAFAFFESANALGTALSSTDKGIKDMAEAAMKSIGHVKSSYWDWFINQDYLEKNSNKILCVLTQENLNEDFLKFKADYKLSVGDLPNDQVKSHRNPDDVDKKLSTTAIANLKNWYSKDYDFLAYLYAQKLISIQYQ